MFEHIRGRRIVYPNVLIPSGRSHLPSGFRRQFARSVVLKTIAPLLLIAFLLIRQQSKRNLQRVTQTFNLCILDFLETPFTFNFWCAEVRAALSMRGRD